MSYQQPSHAITTIQALWTIAAALLVAWLIHSVAQLKPEPRPALTQTASPPASTTRISNPSSFPSVTQPEPSLVKQTVRADAPLDPVANTLNALLHDYFTTSFDEEAQARWRYQLSAGSPYLAELASYLKLDQLYDLDLSPSASRRLSEQYRAEAPLDTSRSSLFDVLNHHAEDFWPMSIIAGDPDNTYREKLLLNHYDRDFLIKIERGGFADELAPLAPGIQRLLEYHLRDVVDKSAGLRISRRTRSIDQTVRAMTPYAGQDAVLFHFYNAVIKSEWDTAAELLMMAPRLTSERYHFLYDLMATSAPQALLQQVTLSQYQRRQDWWDQFLYFEACLNRNPSWLVTLNRRLSILMTCRVQEAEGVTDIAQLPDRLIATFWEQILTTAQLTDFKMDAYYAQLTSAQRNQLLAINSHTIIDFLARKGRIRVIRNSTLYQRIEVNFQAWQSRFAGAESDSFYQYSPLLHWFSSRRMADPELHQELALLLPELSVYIQQAMADQLLDHLDTASIQARHWPVYEFLAQHLNNEERYLLQRFTELQPELVLSTALPASPLPPASKTRLDQAALEMVFNARLWNLLDNAYSYDDFLMQGEQLIRTLSNEHRGSRFEGLLAETLNQHNQLSRRALSHFNRLWQSAYPERTIDHFEDS